MQIIKIQYFKRTGINLLVLFFLLLVGYNHVFAQRHEFGVGLSGYNYTGDVNPRYNFTNYRPGGTVFYRYNPSWATAIRLAFSYGQLSGNEKNSKEPVAQVRQANFNSSVTQVTLMGEYNFINYRDKKQLYKFAPYLAGGIALAASSPQITTQSSTETGGSDFGLVIPFGIGCKFILNKNWNFGTEFIAHKTFTDYLDGVSNGSVGNKTTGNIHDNDWYFQTSFHISYTIYGVNCPQQFKY